MITIYLEAQNPNNAFEDKDKFIKVKLVKSISYGNCEKIDLKKNAVVLEFDVLLSEDKKKYSNKIYAAVLCYDLPGEGMFNREYDCDLQLYENKHYQSEISILNEDLLDKNINRKKYWVKDIRRKITVHSGSKKQ